MIYYYCSRQYIRPSEIVFVADSDGICYFIKQKKIYKEGCTINSSHEAGAQMLGYLYQVRFALYMLLKNDNSDAQISIEKFDDVTFETNGTPYELIQLKHHTNKAGSLSDKSGDLWRTLKVWIDMINSDKTLLETTDFVIITTAQVNEGTAAFKIQKNECSEAYSILKETAQNSVNKENKPFYQSFLSMDEKEIKKLLSHICILSSAPDIVDVLENIKKILKYSCPFEYLDTVTERVEGWWFIRCPRSFVRSCSRVLRSRAKRRSMLST